MPGLCVRLLALTVVTMLTTHARAVDIDALWEYDDPALSEARFRAALDSTSGDERLAVLTQIARTYSLRGRFGEAHRLLDQVEGALGEAGAQPRVRYLLERGRTLNSSGERNKARALFMDAWAKAGAAHLDSLAVDAAHMVAISYSGTEDAIEWNRKGLVLARASQDAKAQALIPAMLNNSAWDLHDMGRYADALPLFDEALGEWAKRSRPAQVHFARWSVGRCLRSLRRLDQALALQLALARDDAARGTVDGYVMEEIAELYEALGRTTEARPYFARAATLLSDDADLVKNEPARIERLRARGR